LLPILSGFKVKAPALKNSEYKGNIIHIRYFFIIDIVFL